MTSQTRFKQSAEPDNSKNIAHSPPTTTETGQNTENEQPRFIENETKNRTDTANELEKREEVFLRRKLGEAMENLRKLNEEAKELVDHKRTAVKED